MTEIPDKSTRRDRYRRLEERAGAAEWDVPSGRVGGVVRQLRFRAASARRQANVFLVTLLVVTTIGLLVFVIAPYAVDYFSGQRQTLAANKRALEDQRRLIAPEMETIREQIASRLTGRMQRIDTGMSDGIFWLAGHVLPDGRALLVGDEGAMAIYDADVPGTVVSVEAEGMEGWTFDRIVATVDGEILVVAREGIARFDPMTGTAVAVWTVPAMAVDVPTLPTQNPAVVTRITDDRPPGAVLSNGDILFGGASGRFWRYRLATGTADLVEIPTEVVMDRVTAIVAMDD
ncbi:MAG: hypothetical protein WBA67_15165, partial [Jannaschia sp.]